MPQIGLRGFKVAKYVNTNGLITYTNQTEVGDAITANLELRVAEGRLWAEDGLAEYIRKATGGTISIGVKYIKTAAQKLMFGLEEKTRSIGTGTASVTGLVATAKQTGNYVGFACYAPDVVDGEDKFACFFVHKARFGQPNVSLQTSNDGIAFQTPVTNGEFLMDDSEDKAIMESATVDTEAEAIAWIEAVLA